MIPIISAATMFSVEVSKHQSNTSAVRKAADSALLMGARSMAKDMINDKNFNARKSREKAQAIAMSAFSIPTQKIKLGKSVQTLETDFYVEGNSIEGEVSFRGQRDAIFNLFDSTLFKIEFDATASIPIRQRVDIHFVIDNSPSMNVGAYRNDQTIMIQESGCAFACHRGDSKAHPDYLRGRGAKMRIDVVADAVSSAIEQFKEVPDVQAEIFIGLHTFSNTAETLEPLTNDLDRVGNVLANLDTVNVLGQGGTNFHTSFNQISNEIREDDSEPYAVTPAKRYIIVLTDAIGSAVQWTHETEHQYVYDPSFVRFEPSIVLAQGLDPRACADFKRLENTEVVIMELEYLPVARTGDHTDATGIFVERDLKPRVGTNTRSCASSYENVYFVEEDQAIEQQVEAMVADVIGKLGLRLTH